MHNHKLTSNNKSSGAILFKHRTKPKNSSGRFVILLIIPLLLAVSSNIITYADATTSTTLTVDNSNTVLELALPSNLTLDLTPSSTNNYISFGTSNLNILAGTNNPYGLTLTMSVPDTNLTNSSTTITNDETHNPNNIPLDSSNHPIIPTLSSGTTYTESSFTTNTWGYKLSTDTNYSAVPSSLELLNTDYAHNAITTTLNLAAKVDSTRLAGVYSAVLNFNMIANAKPASLINFYIDGTLYQAEEGMTWREWVNSSYGNGYSMDGTYVVRSDNNFYHVGRSSCNGVKATSIITAGYAYTTYHDYTCQGI